MTIHDTQLIDIVRAIVVCGFVVDDWFSSEFTV